LGQTIYAEIPLEPEKILIRTQIGRRIQMPVIANLTLARSPAAGEFIEVNRCPQFGRETMADSFTGMHSAIAFRFRLRPNRRKVQRPRSLRLLGGRAKVSSGRLSVRFRVPRFDLNPW
jgi:hypothetical protein